MRLWEIVAPNPLQSQKWALDAEQKALTQKKKSLKVRTVQDSLSKAIKDRSESATKSGALSHQLQAGI